MRNTSPGTLVLGVFAVLFGLVGAFGAKKYLQQQAPPPEASEPTEQLVAIPLAVRDIPAGRTIADGDVATVKLTNKQISQMKLPPSYMADSSQVIGRTLREAVARGQAFDPTAFYPDGIGPSVADQLAPGQRAVTIPFDGNGAEAGLITPGAMVDVLFRTSPRSDESLPETTVTLLDNVKVLAVDREILEGAIAKEKRGATNRTVTLAVDPVQARALKVVEDRGTLTLVLRNGDDVALGDQAAPTTLHDLLGTREAEQPMKTEIYRRGQLTTVVFAEDGRRVTHETPFSLPVVSRSRMPTEPVSYTQASSTQASGTSSNGTQACGGCGSAGSRSVLANR